MILAAVLTERCLTWRCSVRHRSWTIDLNHVSRNHQPGSKAQEPECLFRSLEKILLAITNTGGVPRTHFKVIGTDAARHLNSRNAGNLLPAQMRQHCSSTSSAAVKKIRNYLQNYMYGFQHVSSSRKNCKWLPEYIPVCMQLDI